MVSTVILSTAISSKVDSSTEQADLILISDLHGPRTV